MSYAPYDVFHSALREVVEEVNRADGGESRSLGPTLKAQGKEPRPSYDEYGVIFPKYLNDADPDWLMICEGWYHAVRVSTELRARDIKVKLVSREQGHKGWTECTPTHYTRQGE